MSAFVGFMNNILYQPYIVPLFLIAVGLYFTIRTKAVQIRLFPEMFRVVMEKPENESGMCVCRWECVRRSEIRKYIQRGMMDEIKFWFFLDDNSV